MAKTHLWTLVGVGLDLEVKNTTEIFLTWIFFCGKKFDLKKIGRGLGCGLWVVGGALAPPLPPLLYMINQVVYSYLLQYNIKSTSPK